MWLDRIVGLWELSFILCIHGFQKYVDVGDHYLLISRIGNSSFLLLLTITASHVVSTEKNKRKMELFCFGQNLDHAAIDHKVLVVK